MKPSVLLLRIFHGLIAVYFTLCLAYLYYVGITLNVNDTLFVLAVCSLAIEGILVFTFNNGDCPLIHIQRRVGDDRPFFELMLPGPLAKMAIPVFAGFTMVAITILLLRFVVAG